MFLYNHILYQVESVLELKDKLHHLSHCLLHANIISVLWEEAILQFPPTPHLVHNMP